LILCASLSGLATWKFSAPPDHAGERRIVAVALSPGARWIAAGASNGWVTLWDRENPEHERQFDTGAAPEKLAFSPDEKALFVQSREMALYGVEQWETPRAIEKDPGWSVETAADVAAATSNVVPGPEPGSVMYGTAAGSVEVWDPTLKKIVWQRSLR
jgi:hypothetical protein